MKFLQICLLFAILRSIYAEITGIRLLGGMQPNQGHLQVQFDRSSTFGYVCGDMWTVENSKVLCRQMGYPGLVRDYRTTSGLSFVKATGTDTEPVYNVASVTCQGDEFDLVSCPNNHSIMTCSIDQTVSIICQDFGYLGCFRQRSGGQIVPNSVQFLSDVTSNDQCIDRCGEYYDYAGSSGAVCSCTFEQPSVELDQVADERCTAACASNHLQACGMRSEAESRPYFTFYSTRNGLCDAQPAPTNGNVTASYNRFGDVVNFSCTPGYGLVGMESLQCIGISDNSSELSWNGEPPFCYALELQATSSTHAMESTTFTASTTAGLSTTVSSTNPTTSPGSSTTTGSDIVGFLDVKIIALLAGLITISVCFIILIIVFVCCFVSRRRKRMVEEDPIELQPMQCPSPPPQIESDPPHVVKNEYVSDKKMNTMHDVGGIDNDNDDDVQVQHNYCSVHRQPPNSEKTKRTSDTASTDLLIQEDSNETEYACAYDCVGIAKVGSGSREVTEKKGSSSGGAEGYMVPPGKKVESYHEAVVGPESPISLRDHEYIYIENAHTPPFLTDKSTYDQNAMYETPMRADATTVGGNIKAGPHHRHDPPHGHVFHEVKHPLNQRLSQDTGHYLNENVMFPRSRANRDMTNSH